jgi:hypothetical protein
LVYLFISEKTRNLNSKNMAKYGKKSQQKVKKPCTKCMKGNSKAAGPEKM